MKDNVVGGNLHVVRQINSYIDCTGTLCDNVTYIPKAIFLLLLKCTYNKKPQTDAKSIVLVCLR